MGKNKISVLKYLKLCGPKTALDIAKKHCGEDRSGYKAWYDRLIDMQADGHVLFHNNDRFPLCKVELTPSGEDALEHDQKLRAGKRIEWIRYIITTAIAVAAFVKSFFF